MVSADVCFIHCSVFLFSIIDYSDRHCAPVISWCVLCSRTMRQLMMTHWLTGETLKVHMGEFVNVLSINVVALVLKWQTAPLHVASYIAYMSLFPSFLNFLYFSFSFSPSSQFPISQIQNGSETTVKNRLIPVHSSLLSLL